jgi:cell division protein FtsQ
MQPLSGDRYPVYARKMRHDPAPSRWSYRLQRLWLTPMFRVLFRVGLPVLLIGSVAGLYFSDEARRGALIGVFTDMRDAFEQRPEFRVSLTSVEGASPELAEAVRARLGLTLPASSFDLDLDAARQRVEGLDAVAQAELRVRSGGVLQVLITERVPALVWRQGDALALLDATGHRVAGLAARGDRPDLPLVAGDGAEVATPEALEILAAAEPILPRVRGLVRVGERRWDLVLDRNQKIMLPAVGAVPALERLIVLDKAEDLLARDLLTVDLRIENRPVLRLAPNALAEHRKAEGIETTGGSL